MEKVKKDIGSLMFLVIEKFRLNRRNSRMVFDKGGFAYLLILAGAAVGLVSGYFGMAMFMLMFVFAFAVLLASSIPYFRLIASERKVLDSITKEFGRPR